MADFVYKIVFLTFFYFCCDIEQNIFVSSQQIVEPLPLPLHPAPDFSRHTLIKPHIYHGREKRQITSTKNKDDNSHLNHLIISYNLNGKDWILDLHLNIDLITKGYFHKYQKNGVNVVHKHKPEDIELCHYNGKMRDVKNSWVALSTCHKGISGVIFDGEEMHYIEKGDDNHLGLVNGTHFIYKHSDLAQNNKTCGYEGGNHNHSHKESNEFNRILRYKRELKTNNIKGPYKTNKQSRYVELILVIDNALYKKLGENKKKVVLYSKDVVNIVNSLYTPLNVYIALIGVEIWSEFDQIVLSKSMGTTLTNFVHYRKTKLIKEHPHDNAQLLSNFAFVGAVGMAVVGFICREAGVNSNHSPVIGLVAATIAHEMGHNFGMDHDSKDCYCKDERCIMASYSSYVPLTHWSSCSSDYLAVAFEHGMDYCLKNKPESLFDSPTCGNGFVEPGEQCDCGLPENCDNVCCNATTCTLFTNATCATGECCDLKTCRPKAVATLCRSADIECDLPEYCSGQSEYCPQDVFKINGESCSKGKAYCYQGSCRTRTDQCRILWGDTGKSSDDRCYKYNVNGNLYGNCGYNKLNETFYKCEKDNVFCGMLHCIYSNNASLQFRYNDRVFHGSRSISENIFCEMVNVDLGLNQIDQGLAPNGAKCGNNMMCVNQKCVSVESIKKIVPECPNDCNGNGFCNSLGQCHCKDGFGPPFCDGPGPGGSHHSGPATDPNPLQTFVTALFIIFLGIVPALAIIAFLSYYTRHNLKLLWKKSTSTYVVDLFCYPCQHVSAACKGVGRSGSCSNKPTTISTVSHNVSANNSECSVQIRDTKPAKLIIATNQVVIEKSSSLNKVTPILNNSRQFNKNPPSVMFKKPSSINMTSKTKAGKTKGDTKIPQSLVKNIHFNISSTNNSQFNKNPPSVMFKKPRPKNVALKTEFCKTSKGDIEVSHSLVKKLVKNFETGERGMGFDKKSL